MGRTTCAVLVSLFISVAIFRSSAATTAHWDAASGRYPTDLPCPWTLQSDTAGSPSLAGGKLTISTSGSGTQSSERGGKVIVMR